MCEDCVCICATSLCFTRTARNLTLHVRRVAQMHVLILITDGINCLYGVFTFNISTVNDREIKITGKIFIFREDHWCITFI